MRYSRKGEQVMNPFNQATGVNFREQIQSESSHGIEVAQEFSVTGPQLQALKNKVSRD